MTKIDEKIKQQMAYVYDIMKTLHNHWVRAGAIIGKKDNYHIKVDENTTAVYLPAVDKMAIGFPGRIHGFNQGVIYCKDGSFTFINHMDEKEMNHFSETLRHVRGAVLNIREKAMDYSSFFMLEVKKNELLNCAKEILNNYSEKLKLLNLENNKTDSPNIVEIEIKNRLSLPKFFVSIDMENRTLQFFKKTPSGENEPLAYYSKSKISSLPDYIGFNNAESLDDKNIIINACLFEAEAFNSSLRYEINEIENVIKHADKKIMLMQQAMN